MGKTMILLKFAPYGSDFKTELGRFLNQKGPGEYNSCKGRAVNVYHQQLTSKCFDLMDIAVTKLGLS